MSDYIYDWWRTSLRCPKCDTKILFNDDIKPLVKDWKLGDLPKKLFYQCTNKRCMTELWYDIFIEVERRFENE